MNASSSHLEAMQHRKADIDSATFWINAMAARLAHLKDAPEATLWEAIPPLFPEVYGSPCDREDGYHVCLAEAVVAAVREMR